MSRRYARVLVAGCAAVLAATLGTSTALAAATWTVQPGGPVLLKSGRVTLTDTKTDNSASCQSARVSGTLQGGSGLSGTGAGSITGVSFRCEGTGVPNLVMQAAGLPWQVNFISYNAATGTVSHVQIKLKPTFEVPCGALVNGMSSTGSDGMVKFTYADSTGRLKVLTAGGNLHFYHVKKSCAGLINNGEPVTLRATFTLSPAQTITSP
jgi:hypothetical protein